MALLIFCIQVNFLTFLTSCFLVLGFLAFTFLAFLSFFFVFLIAFLTFLFNFLIAIFFMAFIDFPFLTSFLSNFKPFLLTFPLRDFLRLLSAPFPPFFFINFFNFFILDFLMTSFFLGLGGVFFVFGI